MQQNKMFLPESGGKTEAIPAVSSLVMCSIRPTQVKCLTTSWAGGFYSGLSPPGLNTSLTVFNSSQSADHCS